MEVEDLEEKPMQEVVSPPVELRDPPRSWDTSSDSMDEDAKWLQRFEKKFNHYSGEDNLIQLDEFIQVLNIKESFFAERFFEFVDQDNSGSISLKELLTALRLLINGKPTDKLHLLFRVYDVDGNGSIDFEELRTVLRFCMAESALSLSEETLSELTEVLFEDADADGNGMITFEELRNQLDRYPDIASNLTISAAEWLRPPRRKTHSNKIISYFVNNIKTKYSPFRLLSNNIATVFLLVVYFLINVGCGVWGAMDVFTTTPERGWLMLARFNGRPLNFNCAFILALMLRKSLTWLRSTRIAAILPVDQHVTLHKLVGIVVVVETFFHVVGHFGNCADLIIQNATDKTAWQILFTPASGVGWIGALAFPTGWPILIILIFICTFSFPFVRRRGYFQVFYWTHQLSILFWLFLIVHARYFWAVFLIPGVVYLIEKVLRLSFIRRVRNGKTYIKEAINLPANVTYLIITRPPNFDFRAGEYVFVCIPSIARHEWHPFTISSAPELKDYITLHIRAQGNWTKRLFNFVKKHNSGKVVQPTESQSRTMLDAVIEERSISGRRNSALFSKSAVSVLKSESEISQYGTPATVRQVDVIPTDDNCAVRNFSAKCDMGEDLTSIRSYEIYDHTAHAWMRGDVTLDDRKALLSRGSSKSSSSNTNSNEAASSAKSRGPLPVLRGTPPTAVRSEKLGRKSGKRKNLKSANKIKPISGENLASSPSSDTEKLRTVSESMANNNNSASTQPEGQAEERQSNTKDSPSKKRLANAVSTTVATDRLLRRKRGELVQRRTQHSLDLTNHPGWDVDVHTGIEIVIDGPYGAPAQHIYEAEHAVLIAGGIGVTPFASILQSIHQRYKEYKLFDPMCWSSSHIPNSEDKAFNLRKVDFIWINRHQKSFEWFISLLNLIEVEQEEIDPSQRFITMHLYMTSALSRNDVKAIGLYVALDLIHQKQRRDMITGLMTRTQAGRPDWDKLFTSIGQENCGKVTVFFCGSPQLGHVVQQKCHERGFGFRKENF